MTENTERLPLITPAGYHNMRGLFAEQARSHEAKIARAEGLIETLDDDERALTHTERQMCIEALGLLIRDSRVSAELLREGVDALDQQTATTEPSIPVDDDPEPTDTTNAHGVGQHCAACVLPIEDGTAWTTANAREFYHYRCIGGTPEIEPDAEEDGDDYGHRRTEYDHDDQDIGDVLGLDGNPPEF